MLTVITNNYAIYILNDGDEYSVSNSKKIPSTAVLINFNDHIQLIKISNSYNICTNYNSLNEIHDKCNMDLKFDRCNELGYLTVCPSNAGTGLKVSAFMKIPKVINDGNTAILFSKWSLRSKKADINSKNNEAINEYEDLYEVLSKCKQKVDPVCFMDSFILKINSLCSFERKLINDDKFVVKKVDYLTGSCRSIYECFYDQYKFVSTSSNTNNKSAYFFNDLFRIFNNNFTNNVDNMYNLPLDVMPTTYDSMHIYRDFIFDYITGESGVYMIKYNETYNSTFNKNKKDEVYNFYTKIINEDNFKYDLKEHLTSLQTIYSNVKHVDITYKFNRNIKELDFYNSKTDSSNLVSSVMFTKMFAELTNKSKNVSLMPEKENAIKVLGEKTKVYCATDRCVNNTNGNHITITSHSIEELDEIDQIIGHIVNYKFDNFYGYLSRNILYCGSGFSYIISLKLDNKIEDLSNNINNIVNDNAKTIEEDKDNDIAINVTTPIKTKLNIDKLKISAEKHDIKVIEYNTDEILLSNIYSLTINREKILKNLQEFIEELLI